MFKKILTIFTLCLFLSINVNSFVHAEETIYSSIIPNNMPANIIIEYEGNSIWKTVNEINESTSILNYDILKDNKLLTLNRFSNAIDDLKLKISAESVYEMTYPDPEIGMKVKYDNWGEIEKVYVLRDNQYKEVEQTFIQISKELSDVSLVQPCALAQGKRKPIGTYKYGSVVQKTKDKVGYKTNKIKITKNSVIGTGDFTVFTDKIGDHDNVLKKGDCATKGTIDNPKYNKKITVTNKLNNTTATFVKNDNGSLPNAVIDIWKTGVKMLGVKSTNYSNIKKACKYKYTY